MRRQHTIFTQDTDCFSVFSLVQTVYQQASLMRRKFLKLFRQHLELFDFYQNIYLIDWYNNSTGLNSTAT